MLWACLIGVSIGVLSEAGARVLRLWLYQRPLYPMLNVLLMFGLVMGAVSLLSATLGLAAVFLIGLGIGLAYEWLNFLVLNWWHFPDNRFLVFRGRFACAASVAVTWGAVPLVIHGIKIQFVG